MAWNAVGLQARLEREWGRHVEVRVVRETGSTNTDLLDLVRGDPSQAGIPRVLLAESQTAGRGRLGRQWQAAERALGLKAAGILIETLPLPATPPPEERVPVLPGSRWVVVGIGINVRVNDLDPRALAAQGAAGTERWRSGDDAAALWHEVLPSVCRALDDFERNGFKPIRTAVQERELLVGQAVTLSAGPEAVSYTHLTLPTKA